MTRRNGQVYYKRRNVTLSTTDKQKKFIKDTEYFNGTINKLNLKHKSANYEP